MSNAEDLIRIREKLKQLIDQHHTLYSEKLRLTAEIEKIKTTLAEQLSTNQGLNDQLSAAKVKTSTSGLGEPEKAEIEKKINHYIKEIDRCISQLGN
jgi:septal ring factor EnvC (AmiA/AmiB activator)